MRKSIKRFFAVTLLIIVIGLAVVIKFGNIGEIPEAILSNGWNLILVNSESRIPDDYEIDLFTLSNGERIDGRIYPDLQKMFNDMRE